MNRKNHRSTFTSRYAVKKNIYSGALWSWYSVDDSLSGRGYLLFHFEPSPKIRLSDHDLRMRGVIFPAASRMIPAPLSIQESEDGIFFLLPESELSPAKEAARRLDPLKALESMRALVSEIMRVVSSGLFFGNLSVDTVAYSGTEPMILPAACLVPHELLELLGENDEQSGQKKGRRCADPLIHDLNSLGSILSLFADGIESRHAEECRSLAAALLSLNEDTGAGAFYDLMEKLAGFAGLDPSGAPRMTLMSLHPTPYEHAMRTLRQLAFKSREEEKHLVIIKGRKGCGKTGFLEAASRNLSSEWGFSGKGIISDQELFCDFEVSDVEPYLEFAIFDDHLQTASLCSYIIDKLSRALESCKISLIAVNEDPPATFIEGLKSEARIGGFKVDEIDLPVLDDDAAAKLAAAALPPPLRGSFIESAGNGRTLARLGSAARIWNEAAPPQRAKGKLGSILDLLTPEERLVLDFIAVFRFEVPLSVLHSIYSPEETGPLAILEKLVKLGLVRQRAEKSVLCQNKLCMVYSISGVSTYETIISSMPSGRRKQMQRNMARMLKEIPGAPLAYIFHHLTECGESKEAAMQGLEIFHLLLGRRKINAVNCFHEYFTSSRLDRHLPNESCLKLYLELGDYFALIGNIEKAEQLFRKCREETSKKGERQNFRGLAVEAIRRECEILEKRGDFTKAESLLKKTLDTHGEHILSNERAKIYNDLAWINYRLGQFNESWEYCILVHKLIDKKQYPKELAQSYNLMGAIYWNRSRYDEALLCHKKCLTLREECNDENGVGASYNNLGLVYRSMGKIKDALESFTKSMKIKQRHNNLPGLAAAHLNLALAYLDLEEISKGEKNCEIAKKLAEDTGNQQLLAEIYGTMGDIFYQKGEHDRARDYFFQDLHICDKTKSLREKAIVLRRLGELDLAEGKMSEAGGLLGQARALNQKMGSRLETALLDMLEGRILLAEGKRERGRIKLEGTSFELSLLGRKSTAASVAAEIGELYLEEGNEHLAREYLLRAISLIGESEKAPKQVLHLQEHLEKRSALETGRINSDSARFRALCRVISFIRTLRDADKLYRTVTETARRITNMERAALILQNDGQDTFRILASVGDFESEGILTDKNMIAILNTTRQLGYPLDVSRTIIPGGKVSESYLQEHPGIICTPLWIQDEVTGFLYLDSPQVNAVTSDEDHSFLVAFSQQVALGIERILLSERIGHMERSRPAPGAGRSIAAERINFQDIIGKSPAIREVYELIDNVKDMDTTILLTGPNGSGKDLIAKAIHYAGPRNNKPFHPLNCAAFPRDLLESELFGHEKGSFTGAHKLKIGHFESAAGGTIFLNEIGDIPLDLQAKLLHVLEEQKFFRLGGTKEIRTNVRILAATNRDLKRLVRQGSFREDLFYRINVFPIRIPALSERREDIKLLCSHFLTMYCRLYNIPTKRISPEAMTYLEEYDWPGNVRELENTINRLIIISKKDTILPEDLPEGIIQHSETVHAEALTTLEDVIDSLLDNLDYSGGDPVLQRFEKTIIRKVVEKTGDKSKAAKILGISKPTLYARLKKYE